MTPLWLLAASSPWEAKRFAWLQFTNKLPTNQISFIIQELLTSSSPISQVIQTLFNNTTIVFKDTPKWQQILPGTHSIWGSYIPWTLTIYPFLYHTTNIHDTNEISRLTISKLMQEYAHILQQKIYTTQGYYTRYIIDLFRCHLEPLMYIQSPVATLKASYRNTRYFEWEAHNIREPIWNLIFIMTYIQTITWSSIPPLENTAKVKLFIDPDSHPSLSSDHSFLIAQFFNDYFYEFQWRTQLSADQIITRSTHLSDYTLANKRLQKANSWENSYTLSLPKLEHHHHGISVDLLLDAKFS